MRRLVVQNDWFLTRAIIILSIGKDGLSITLILLKFPPVNSCCDLWKIEFIQMIDLPLWLETAKMIFNFNPYSNILFYLFYIDYWHDVFWNIGNVLTKYSEQASWLKGQVGRLNCRFFQKAIELEISSISFHVIFYPQLSSFY